MEYAGIGTQLQMGDGASPEVFTTIAQVGDIAFGPVTANTYPTTTHDNTLGGYDDFIAGLKKGGDAVFTLYFDALQATHKDATGGFLYAFNAGAAKNWRIILAGYASPVPKWSFVGVPTSMGTFEYKVDGVQVCTGCKITVKGKPTLA
jgi:hypothetical protein